jgi:hypothetical protein
MSEQAVRTTEAMMAAAANRLRRVIEYLLKGKREALGK